MSSFFETELSSLKSVGNTLRKDILRYRKNIQFGPNTLYDPANWDSLIHYYPLNGNPDDSVSSLNLTENGSPSYVSAIDQEGVAFNGTDQSLSNGSAGSLPTSAITVAGWINVPNFNSYRTMISHAPSGGGTPSFNLGANSSGELQTYLTTADDGTINFGGQTQPVLSTGTDYFLAFTYDGSNLRQFLNGVEENSQAATGSISYNGTDLWIGRSPNQGYSELNYADELLIFNSALSASDIDSLYQAGV